jgi:hypothetical protein
MTHKYSTVHNGEQWCDTHDSAYPCPVVDAVTANHATLWVCQDCYLTHHGYSADELGNTPDREPLGLLGDYGMGNLTAGLMAEEHDDSCPVWLGDPNRPDVPVREAECDCEHDYFSSRQCDGCGSYLAGTRDALTLFTEGE